MKKYTCGLIVTARIIFAAHTGTDTRCYDDDDVDDDGYAIICCRRTFSVSGCAFADPKTDREDEPLPSQQIWGRKTFTYPLYDRISTVA